jgi:Protein of unknown function (DUF3618)
MTEQAQQTPEEIRAEIERTRRELGDTVDALSHKANVKERVSSNPVPLAAIVGGGIAVLLLLRMRRKR